jgi:DNA-binding beta-propeller fold protein YncE
MQYYLTGIIRRPVKDRTAHRVYLATALLFLALYAFLYFLGRPELPSYGPLNIIGGTPSFQQVIYGGFGDEQLNRPLGVFAASDRIYVCDTNNRRIVVFDRSGRQLFTFGETGERGGGKFIFPYGIAEDGSRILVGDLHQGRIHTFDSEGEFTGFFAEELTNKSILTSPGDIHLSRGKAYITEIKRNRVLVVDLQTEDLLMEVGLDGDLFAPNGVTTDNNGNIFVVDTGHARIAIFGPDGNPLRVINGSSTGHGASMLVNPRGIGLDRFGRIIVANNMGNNIMGFGKTGQHVFSFGGQGNSLYQFLLPNGLHIDSGGRIYITDSMNRRVVVYQ